jgi:hypothetical protein
MAVQITPLKVCLEAVARIILKVENVTLRQYIKRHEDLAKFVAERNEDLLDMAESHVAIAIMQGDLATIRWGLPPLQGLSRGWTRCGANLNGGINLHPDGRGGLDISAAIAADAPGGPLRE